MKNFNSSISKLPTFVRNKYFLVFCGFVVWMLFFDRNDWISQSKLQNTSNRLDDKIEYYQTEIDGIIQADKELFTNDKTLERFAREQYLMKKDDEDIFVIVNE